MATVVRITGIVFGIFFLLLSIPMIIGGVVALSVPAVLADNDGYMYAPTVHLTSEKTYAFVTESFMMGDFNQYDSDRHSNRFSVEFDDLGQIVNFRVKADSYFIGLAPTSELQQYLGNVSYVVVDQMKDGYISSYAVNEGTNGSLLTVPTDQVFWIASGVDQLQYTPKSSDFNQDLTFVVMKSDGSQGVDADVKIGVDLPILKPIGIGLVIFGSVFFVVTIGLFVIAYKSKDQSKNVKYVYLTSPEAYQGQKQTESVEEVNHDKLTFQATKGKYCNNCGSETDLDAKFCESCGFKLTK